MEPSRTGVVIGSAIALAANTGWAEPIDPAPRQAPPRHVALIVSLESGMMRHSFTPPAFDSSAAVASRVGPTRAPHERAVAIGPHFLFAIDLSRNLYGGIELAAGGLSSSVAVIREGVDVTDSGFYIGLRAIAGTRMELGRLSLAAELAPGLNDVSFESPSMRDKRGNPLRFDETAFEIDVRTRVDVRVTRVLTLGAMGGAGLFDRHDVSAALTLGLRSRPR